MAAFHDVEKAFNMFGTMDSGIKSSCLTFLPKMIRWLSDFLVGQVIQVNVNGFISDKINPITGVPQGSVLSPLLFLINVLMTFQILTTDKIRRLSSLITLFYRLLVKCTICSKTFV